MHSKYAPMDMDEEVKVTRVTQKSDTNMDFTDEFNPKLTSASSQVMNSLNTKSTRITRQGHE